MSVVPFFLDDEERIETDEYDTNPTRCPPAQIYTPPFDAIEGTCDPSPANNKRRHEDSACVATSTNPVHSRTSLDEEPHELDDDEDVQYDADDESPPRKRQRRESPSSSSPKKGSLEDELSLDLMEIDQELPPRRHKRLRKKTTITLIDLHDIESSSSDSADDEGEEEEEENSFIVDNDASLSDEIELSFDEDEEFKTIQSRMEKRTASANAQAADADEDDSRRLAKLAKSMNIQEALTTLDNYDRAEKQRPPVIELRKNTQGNSKESKLERVRREWMEGREERRQVRMAMLQEWSGKSQKIRGMLDKANKARKNMFGSKRKHHPLGLISELYFHQLVGVAYALLREAIPYKGVLGGVLSDEMGAGKTTTLLTLVSFDTINGYTSASGALSHGETHYYPPTLVVCPKNLINTWVSEARDRFESAYLQILILNNDYTPDWETKINNRKFVESDLVIINYESLRLIYSKLIDKLADDIIRHPHKYSEVNYHKKSVSELPSEILNKAAYEIAEKNLDMGYRTLWSDTDSWFAPQFLYGYRFRRVIFDECTHFKNHNTKNFKAVNNIHAERRWLVSGTPLENHMDELYAQMWILGLNKTSRSVRDIKRWHHFLKLDANNVVDQAQRASHIPTEVTVKRLHKRFFKVLQIRREIQNTNAIDILGNYIQRADPSTSSVWDAFVDARSLAKKERSLYRNTDAFVSEDEDIMNRMDGEDDAAQEARKGIHVAGGIPTNPPHEEQKQQHRRDSDDSRQHMYNVHLDELTRKRLESDDNESAWTMITEKLGVDKGFYWYTRQRDFLKGVEVVNGYLREAFDTDIYQIHEATVAARNVLVKLGTSVPVSMDHHYAIETAIEAVMNREPLNPELRSPIKVFRGFAIPKPLIFTGTMHALEQSVYTSLFKQFKEIDASGGKAQAKAFEAIQRARSFCCDYRSGTTSAQVLSELDGTAWNSSTEPVEQIKGDQIIKGIEEDLDEKAEDLLLESDAPSSEVSKPKKTTGRPPVVRSGGVFMLPKREGTKALMLLRYIKAIPKGDKVVVFSDLIASYPFLKNLLESHGIATEIITGKIDMADRQPIFDAFNVPLDEQGDPVESHPNFDAVKRSGQRIPRVLLLSLKCFAQGINLQVANHLVVYGPWFNPAMEEQAKRRVLRPGQLKQVYIIYLALIATVDELVISKADIKENMISKVIGMDDGVVKTSANFSRPNVAASHYMEFQVDDKGGYVIPTEGCWESTLDELMELSHNRDFGATFANIKNKDLISKQGRLNQVRVAEVLTQAPQRSLVPLGVNPYILQRIKNLMGNAAHK